MAYELQDPDEELAYTLKWATWIADGDSISTSSWSINPSTGVTVSDLGKDGTDTSARVSGLTRGQVYRLTGEIVSTDGETGQQSIAIRCADK